MIVLSDAVKELLTPMSKAKKRPSNAPVKTGKVAKGNFTKSISAHMKRISVQQLTKRK